MKTKVIITSQNEMRISEKGWIVIGIDFLLGNVKETSKVKINSSFKKSVIIERNHNES